MTGTMTILRSGEQPLEWDTEVPETYGPDSLVDKKFKEIVGAGGTALADGERLKKFDETKPEIHMLPQYQGG